MAKDKDDDLAGAGTGPEIMGETPKSGVTQADVTAAFGSGGPMPAPADTAKESVSAAASAASSRAGSAAADAKKEVKSAAGAAKAKVGEVAEGAGQAVSEVSKTVSDTASQVSDAASSLSSQLKDQASDVATQARDTYVQARDAAQSKAEDWQQRLAQRVDEKPVQTLLITLGLGFLLGILS